MKKDKTQIDTIVAQFFNLFTNKNGQPPKVQNIHQLFLPEGILIKNTSQESVVYNLESFIKPRVKILTDETLTDFEEWETQHTTQVFSNIAQRTCAYEKSGVFLGQPYAGKGTKLMQLMKRGERWWLVSVIWRDEVQS